MEQTTIYLILAAIAVLLIIFFVISKIVGCGFKILKFAVLLAIIGLAIYGASTFIR